MLLGRQSTLEPISPLYVLHYFFLVLSWTGLWSSLVSEQHKVEHLFHVFLSFPLPLLKPNLMMILGLTTLLVHMDKIHVLVCRIHSFPSFYHSKDFLFLVLSAGVERQQWLDNHSHHLKDGQSSVFHILRSFKNVSPPGCYVHKLSNQRQRNREDISSPIMPASCLHNKYVRTFDQQLVSFRLQNCGLEHSWFELLETLGASRLGHQTMDH